MEAAGSGSLRTLNVEDATFCLTPSISAETVTVASTPTLSGRATHPFPWRESVPLVMTADTSLVGTPGTEMLTGLFIPAYRTFIIVAETVAVGSITV